MTATRSSLWSIALLWILLLSASGCASRREHALARPASDGGVRSATVQTSREVSPAIQEIIVGRIVRQATPSMLESAVHETQKARWALDAPSENKPETIEANGTPACPSGKLRVLLIGDSFSVGLAPHLRRSAAGCGVRFFHHGVVGSHVTEWATSRWLEPQLQRAKPDLVLVSLGGNDMIRNDPERVERGINTFVSKIEKRGARLFWMSPPSMPFPDKVGARSMWASALKRVPTSATYPTELLVIPRVSDRMHPTISGYRDLSETLWRWIARETRADETLASAE